MPSSKRPSTRAARRAKNATRLPKTFEPKFLEHADHRSKAVREITRRLKLLMEDTGADSFQKELLVKRAVFVSVQLETMEANAANGETFDQGVYQQGVNCLSGLLTKLGLEKQVSKSVELADYLEASK